MRLVLLIIGVVGILMLPPVIFMWGEPTEDRGIDWTLSNGTGVQVITFDFGRRGPVVDPDASERIYLATIGLPIRHQIRAYAFVRGDSRQYAYWTSEGETIWGSRGELLFCREIGGAEDVVGTEGTVLALFRNVPPGIFHQERDFSDACPGKSP